MDENEIRPDWWEAYFGDQEVLANAPAPIRTTHKKCFRCQELVARQSFHRNRSNLDGLQDACKDCQRDFARDYYRRNAPRLRPIAASRMRRIYAERKALTSSVNT